MSDVATTNTTSTKISMLDLPCVHMSKKLATKRGITDKKQLPTPSTGVNDLVVALSIAKPLWIFSIDGIGYSGRDYLISVHHDGEQLGDISWQWFRSGYGFVITNDRVAKTKQRSNSARTTDIKKALAIIKKNFFKQNFNEKLAEADKKVNRLLDNELYEKKRTLSRHESDLRAKAVEFAHAKPEAFCEFLDVINARHIMDNTKTAHLEMVTLEAAKKAFDVSHAALVIRDNSQYIVKLRDKVEVMDDTTLPSWLKAKLGMLKLVGDDHVVSDVGCRVDAECFMVLAKEEGEQL